MANNRCTYQQEYTVSIPKQELLERVAYNFKFNERDLRVFMLLLTELNGYKQSTVSSRLGDPDSEKNKSVKNNFKKISPGKISKEFGYSKEEVKKSIKKLMKYGVIEKGDSNGAKDGYRFTF